MASSQRMTLKRLRAMTFVVVPLLILGADLPAPKIGQKVERLGDEIMVCGQLIHTTTPVVLWSDPGGYDAYRVERRFVPWAEASWEMTKETGKMKNPNRFSVRKGVLTPAQIETVRGGGWELPMLQGVVDQFVIHFDACGTSKKCFQVLHDERGLSVHFMLDLDGTIYQTLDLKEGASHATKANSRSIGIEIANIGTSKVGNSARFDKWYVKGPDGKVTISVPDAEKPRNPTVELAPDRPNPIVGNIQGEDLQQYDLTKAQYESLIKLTATLCTVFPKIKPDYPRDEAGKLLPKKIDDELYLRYQGILGHYHVQTNKVDPGPAFQWDRLIDGTRQLMGK